MYYPHIAPPCPFILACSLGANIGLICNDSSLPPFFLKLDRVGGRLDSAELKTAKGSDRWDLGGQWVCR